MEPIKTFITILYLCEFLLKKNIIIPFSMRELFISLKINNDLNNDVKCSIYS